MSSPTDQKRTASATRLRRRTKPVRDAIHRTDFVISGHVHTRTKVCGRPNCRCARDPEARHGPYYEWSHREGGRQRHRIVTLQQAELLQHGIDNLRLIQSLLADWERQSAEEILKPNHYKPG